MDLDVSLLYFLADTLDENRSLRQRMASVGQQLTEDATR